MQGFSFNSRGWFGRPGGADTFEKDQCVTLANPAKSDIENKTEYPIVANLEHLVPFCDPQDGRLIKSRHAKVARMLGDTLTLGNEAAWQGFSFVACARLTKAERERLAFASLQTLEPDQAGLIAEKVICHAGYPLPAFLAPMDDARWWASLASRAERKAYALASYEALSSEDQAAFRAYIAEQEVIA